MNELLRIDCYAIIANTIDFTGLIPKYFLSNAICPYTSEQGSSATYDLSESSRELTVAAPLPSGTWGMCPYSQ